MVNSKSSKFNSALFPVPDDSASQSYLSSCDAECLSTLFLNDFTEGAVTTENGRLFHSFAILMLKGGSKNRGPYKTRIGAHRHNGAHRAFDGQLIYATSRDRRWRKYG